MNDAMRQKFQARFITVATDRLRLAMAELATNATTVARELHSLAGEAGMIGLVDISSTAAELNKLAKAWQASPPTNEQRLAFARRLRSLMATVTQLRDETAAPSTSPVTPVKRSALIVEDSNLVAEELAEALEAAGFVVATAATFDAVLASLAERSPEVVLLDAHLPGVDSAAVCERVRATSGAAKVVLVSGDANEELHERARAIRTDGAISKLDGTARVVEYVQTILRSGAP